MSLARRETAAHRNFVPLFGVLAISFWLALPKCANGQGLKPVAFNFPPRDYTCPGQIIAAGDFNNDGHPDLICLGYPGLILLGDGRGGFKPGIDFPTSDGEQVVLDDLNGDGNLDIIVLSSNYNPLLSIYLGNGDGTFQAPTTISEFTYNSSGMATGDINGDGKLDLLLMEVGAPVAVVFLGNGDGTFRDGGTIELPYIPGYPALVDLNGDGALDLVISEFSDTEAPTLTVVLGNGDGTFKPATSSALLGDPGPVLVGDFNGDGKQDVLVYSISGLAFNVSDLLLGNGDGTFQAPKPTLSGVSSSGLTVADFNHDGKLDIAAQITNQNKVEIFLGDGSGNFSSFASFPIASSVDGYCAQGLVTGLFNSDSNLDLAIGGPESPVVSLLLGKGNGTFVLPPHVDDHNLLNVTVGDLNGDGFPDIVSVNSTGALGVLLGNGDSTFQQANYSPAGKGASGIVLGDFNRDGKLDALITSGDGYIAVLPGKGDGTFNAAIVTQAGGNAFSETSAVAVGDFNGDGIPDAAINPEIFLGKGDGTFGPAIPYRNGEGRIALGAADLNGDGKLDLIALESTYGVNGGSELVVLFGDGDGTLRSPLQILVDYGASSFVIADLNGDGIPDIAVATAVTVDILLGNGDGTFQPYTYYVSGVGSSGVSVADFNLDGRPDLAVTNGSGTGAFLMLNNGDGTFRVGSTFLGAAVQSFYPVAGDFNGDGKPDLLVAGKNAIFIYTNTTQQ